MQSVQIIFPHDGIPVVHCKIAEEFEGPAEDSFRVPREAKLWLSARFANQVREIKEVVTSFNSVCHTLMLES